MGKENAELDRKETIEIYSDGVREFLKCPECGNLYEGYLMCLNTKSSRGGAFAKCKCRNCSIMKDGIGEAAREIGKIIANNLQDITIKL